MLSYREFKKLTEDQLEELFGIGGTLSRVATAVKSTTGKVAQPFKHAAAAVQGAGQRIADVSRRMDASANAKAQAAKGALQASQAARAASVDRTRSAVSGRPAPTASTSQQSGQARPQATRKPTTVKSGPARGAGGRFISQRAAPVQGPAQPGQPGHPGQGGKGV